MYVRGYLQGSENGRVVTIEKWVIHECPTSYVVFILCSISCGERCLVMVRFCVQWIKARGGCSFCWSWSYCWPSLLNFIYIIICYDKNFQTFCNALFDNRTLIYFCMSWYIASRNTNVFAQTAFNIVTLNLYS